MKESLFNSPAYSVKKIPIDEIVSQKSNPNQMTGKSWQALQISVYNTGYTFPVIVAENSDYDSATEGMEKPSLIEHTDKSDDVIANTEAGMQVADDEVAKFFKYRLIDGAHREDKYIPLGEAGIDSPSSVSIAILEILASTLPQIVLNFIFPANEPGIRSPVGV